MEFEELVIASQEGDDNAFYELMKLNKVKLYKIAYTYLKNEEDALEAIQETTYRAYTKLKKLKEPKYFKTWLVRILINYCFDELKRQKKCLPMLNDKEISQEMNNDRLDMEWAIDKLLPKYRDIIILKYFEDLRIQDIALILECPEGTVKTWLNKALNDLRIILREGGVDVS